MTACSERVRRMRQVLRLRRPDRMPLMGDWRNAEYRPDVYHLGEPELVRDGEVKTSVDGKRTFTRDGGVWAVGDKDVYREPEDVLDVDLERFEVEEVGPAMLAEQRYVTAWPYGTLVTRATLEFGWEPFLLASAIDPERFGEICARFGEASLAVARGWTRIDGIDLILIHDDIAATRGPILSPEWYRQYAFPWHRRIFDAIHDAGKKAVYVSDGNYLPVLDDVLDNGPDGLYIESTSMDPAELMGRAGKDMIYLLKSDSRNMDHGTPDDVEREMRRLRDLHAEYPGIMMYRGGGRIPENVQAFNRCYQEYLVYGD